MSGCRDVRFILHRSVCNKNIFDIVQQLSIWIVFEPVLDCTKSLKWRAQFVNRCIDYQNDKTILHKNAQYSTREGIQWKTNYVSESQISLTVLYNIHFIPFQTEWPKFLDNATSSEEFEAPSWITRHALLDLPLGQMISMEDGVYFNLIF